MDDILHGGRDDLRGFWGRAGFTTFARIFTGCFLCFVVSFVCLCLFFFVLFVCCFRLPAGEKTPEQFQFHPFCFRTFRELTDHAPCSLGNAGKKKSQGHCSRELMQSLFPKMQWLVPELPAFLPMQVLMDHCSCRSGAVSVPITRCWCQRGNPSTGSLNFSPPFRHFSSKVPVCSLPDDGW